MPRFEVKSLKCVATWNFNLEKNKVCTICRQSLNKNSLTYQEKGIDSMVIPGLCGHCFHSECIEPWAKKNGKCPICFKKWTPKHTKVVVSPNSSDDSDLEINNIE